MQTKLTLLGKSDATVAIIMDILESCNMFPHIEIVNNLNLPVEHPFINPKFTWSFVNEVPQDVDQVALGVTVNTTKSKIILNGSLTGAFAVREHIVIGQGWLDY